LRTARLSSKVIRPPAMGGTYAVSRRNKRLQRQGVARQFLSCAHTPRGYAVRLFALLARHGIAVCASGDSRLALPSNPDSAEFIYLRLRRSDYTRSDLNEWIRRAYDTVTSTYLPVSNTSKTPPDPGWRHGSWRSASVSLPGVRRRVLAAPRQNERVSGVAC
jgi:hypothetical protein